jgi:hypothetical protein
MKTTMELADAYAVAASMTLGEPSLKRLKDNITTRSALAQRIEQLEKDAERYRWLRDYCGDFTIGVFDHAADDKKRFWLSGEQLDKEIDAAMKGETP